MGRWIVRRVLKRALALVIVGSAATPSAGSITYYIAVDVPSTLAGTIYAPHQIVRSDAAIYSPETTLPVGTELAALHRRADGTWLFAPAHPATLGGTDFEPRDLVSYDGVTFTNVLDGSAVGIPDYARIDALLLDGVTPVLSLDVPVNLAGTEYSGSDLVRYFGGVFSLVWDAEAPAAGVPVNANVVGAARDSGGVLVVSFDAPTNLGGTEYLPGQLVRWNNPGFSSYFADPAWPPSSRLRDFAFVPAAGAVPATGTPLTVVTAPAGQITLSWGASCASSDNDYEIYEGTLGAWYSHAAMFCTTGGATTSTFTPMAGSAYYLVVPRNSLREGSYGLRSDGIERPQGLGACIPQEIAVVCP